MMRILSFAILFGLLFGLAGCGGSGEDPACADEPEAVCPADVGSVANVPSTTPTASGTPTRTLLSTGGLIGGNIDVQFNPVTGKFDVEAFGTQAELDRFYIADHGYMQAMRDTNGVHNGYYGSGGGTQVVVYSGGLVGNIGMLASYSRGGSTELPTSGAAQFNGNYAGFTTTARVNGDVQINANFTAATVNGTITNRVFRARPNNSADVTNPLSMVILNAASIRPDGTFTATTSGGQILGGQQIWNPAVGGYAGLIGGSDAGEVVGSVSLTHRAPDGATFDEVGGFLAIR
jgi:hypothetical protein